MTYAEKNKNLHNNQSFDLTRISQLQHPQIDDIGQWDLKLKSSRDKTSRFDKIRRAIQELDKAKLFEASNLQMLMKCAENTEKQIYMDFLLSVIDIQRKQQYSNSKLVDERSTEFSNILLRTCLQKNNDDITFYSYNNIKHLIRRYPNYLIQ